MRNQLQQSYPEKQKLILMPKISLEQAIYATVRYWSLFDMPVTSTQIWRALVQLRGQHIQATLPIIQEALHTSIWLKNKLDTQWGYYFLKNNKDIVERRLVRHRISHTKWALLRKIVRKLQYLPFIQMIATNGSLSISNTNKDSDLDVLIVVKSGRLWTARLCLLLVTQLMGHRRKYWDQRAPDKICLNHYVTDTSLEISPEIRSMYTAMLYSHLVLLSGENMYKQFMHANKHWLSEFVVQPEVPDLPSVHAVRSGALGRALQYFFEFFLSEPLADYIEYAAEYFQRRLIEKHSEPGRAGRIAVSNTELAFHPDSKARWVIEQFQY